MPILLLSKAARHRENNLSDQSQSKALPVPVCGNAYGDGFSTVVTEPAELCSLGYRKWQRRNERSDAATVKGRSVNVTMDNGAAGWLLAVTETAR